MSTTKKSKLPVIRASEIGAYVYCRRAWWFKRVAGFEPQDRQALFDRGTAAHEQHGQQVRRSLRQGQLAWLLLVAGLILIGLAFLNFH